jgi:hypothetical protein
VEPRTRSWRRAWPARLVTRRVRVLGVAASWGRGWGEYAARGRCASLDPAWSVDARWTRRLMGERDARRVVRRALKRRCAPVAEEDRVVDVKVLDEPRARRREARVSLRPLECRRAASARMRTSRIVADGHCMLEAPAHANARRCLTSRSGAVDASGNPA